MIFAWSIDLFHYNKKNMQLPNRSLRFQVTIASLHVSVRNSLWNIQPNKKEPGLYHYHRTLGETLLYIIIKFRDAYIILKLSELSKIRT